MAIEYFLDVITETFRSSLRKLLKYNKPDNHKDNFKFNNYIWNELKRKGS